jgi:hypothetical protein
MAPQRPDDIDRQVRESFGLDPAAVRRVVDGAQVAAADRPPHAWAGRMVLTAATVLALVAAVTLWPRPPGVPAPADQVVSGSLIDGVLVLTWPDGSISIAGPDRRLERPPDGFGIVLVDGELQ